MTDTMTTGGIGAGPHSATLERYFKAMAESDLGAVSDLFADDVTIEWPQSGERFHGKDKCVRVFSNYPGGSPKLLGIRRVTQEGDLAVAEVELQYPDDRRYHTVSVVEFRDGKIAHETDYFAEPFPVPQWRKGWTQD